MRVTEISTLEISFLDQGSPSAEERIQHYTQIALEG